MRKEMLTLGLLDNIKKEAIGNNTKIQSSEAMQLEKIFNRMFYLDKDIDEETKFVKQMMTRGAETQERVGLHASALIVSDKDFCVRQQVLSLIYRQLQGEQIPVGLMRIFEEGNAIHEKWQRLLIRAGYAKAENLDFTQMDDYYKISFTPDILCEIPEFYDGIMVGEIKSVNTFQFKKMTRHPTAYKQMQWYLFLTGLKKGFVLSEDKNTQHFKVEVYDYDREIVAPFIDRAEEIKYHYDRVFEEGKMIKRPKNATGPSSKMCAKCAMRDACYNIGMGRQKIINN